MCCAGGYYATEVRPGLVLVMLNTNMYFTLDRRTAGQADPAGQFAWLEGTLDIARQAQHKVRVPLAWFAVTSLCSPVNSPTCEMLQRASERSNLGCTESLVDRKDSQVQAARRVCANTSRKWP